MKIVWNNMRKGKVLLLILLMVPLGTLPLDILSPSLPTIGLYFATPTAITQMSLTVFMLAFGISQLISGILSDTHGRRSPLLIGMFVYLCGTLLCYSADTYSLFLAGRFFEGLGIGAAAITWKAVMRDRYSGDELLKVAYYTTTIYALVPMLSPIAGGYLQYYFGWRSVILFLFIAPLLISALFYLLLPETNPKKATKGETAKHIKFYGTILKDSGFLLSVSFMIIVWTILMLFPIFGTFLVQKEMKLNEIYFSHCALAMGACFLFGNISGTLLLRKLSAKRIMLLGISVMLLASSLFSIQAFQRQQNMSTLQMVILIGFITFAVGLTFSEALANALSRFPTHAGIASALLGGLIVAGCVTMSTIISIMGVNSLKNYSVIYLVLSMLASIIYLLCHESSRRVRAT